MANEYRRLADRDLDDYVNALYHVLPRGALFRRDRTSNMYKLVQMASDMPKSIMNYISVELMDEMNPAATLKLLEDWEETAFEFDSGEECITRDELRIKPYEDRRRILIARLIEGGAVTREEIEFILRSWINKQGVDVLEFFESRVDIMRCGNSINEATWILVDTGKLDSDADDYADDIKTIDCVLGRILRVGIVYNKRELTKSGGGTRTTFGID